MILIYIFIILFIIGFVFLKLTQKYVNPYKLIMVFGKKGSGKTTFLTKTAINHIKKGYPVYSTIDIPGTVKFDVKDIGKYTFYNDSVVLIDEVGMIWDNRDFKNFKTEVRDFFKFQRQYKLKVYLFSQTFDVDLKLRNLTDEMYLLKNVCRVWSVARRIDKRITIQKGEEGKASTLVDDYTFAPLLSPSSYIITFIPRWIDFFQSYAPKQLPIFDGVYLQPTLLQQLHMSTRVWFFDNLKSAKRNAVKSLQTKMLTLKDYLFSHDDDQRSDSVVCSSSADNLESVDSLKFRDKMRNLYGGLRHPHRDQRPKTKKVSKQEVE